MQFFTGQAFFAFFKVVEAIMGNRVSAEVELEGLDIPEMGAVGYPDFVLAPGHGTAVMVAAKPSPMGAPIMQPAGDAR